MSFFSQIAALTLTGIRGISQRPGASLVTVISIMTVVAVLLSLLSMGAGIKTMNEGWARADRVVILSRGARTAAQSSLPRATVLKVFDAPGIKRTPDGQPYASASLLSGVDVVKKDGRRGTVYLVGVTAGSPLVNPEIPIIEGRYVQPAVREIIVSDTVRKLYRNMNIGDRINLRGGEWTIVGVYKDVGPTASQIRTDADTFMSAFSRNEFLMVTAVLDSPASFTTLKDALTGDPSIAVDVRTDAQVLNENYSQLYRLLDFVAYFIGGVMASGAIFGALNALYASVDSRRREIATLRAIGFSNAPIVISVLAEAMVLAIPGALLGTLIAWLFFNGDVANIQGIVFQLSVTPDLVRTSILWALTIGLIGGSLPALRAARLPVATALRRT